MQTYLIFTFDLGYGDGLPVILPISDQEQASLLALKDQEFSDNDYIYFDENYFTINSVLNNMSFVTLPIGIDYDFSYAKNIINMILDYTKNPVTFTELTVSDACDTAKPQRIVALSPNEQAVDALKKELEPYLEKEKNEPDFDPTAILTRLGPDTQIFSSLEDLVASAELFGICPKCDSVRQEKGCLTCIGYGDEKPYST